MAGTIRVSRFFTPLEDDHLQSECLDPHPLIEGLIIYDIFAMIGMHPCQLHAPYIITQVRLCIPSNHNGKSSINP